VGTVSVWVVANAPICAHLRLNINGENNMSVVLLESPICVYRAVTLRYVCSLAAIALLSAWGWHLMTAQLAEHKRQDDAVSMAGAQRMLTHQMAGLVAESLGAQTEADHARIMTDLASAEARYMTSFHSLSAQIASQAPDLRELRAAYLEGPSSILLTTGKIDRAVHAIENGHMTKTDKEALIAWLRDPAIRSLDRAVAAHKNLAKGMLRDLRFYHVADLLAVLAVLLLEALFVFAPLARRLARQTTEMQRQSRILIETNREMERLASTDGLTRLANRRALDTALAGSATWIPEQPRAAHARPAAATGVISFDLDCFKHVNDVYGHAAGDEVLRAVGERLRALCRTGDLVARMGGDEFTVILYDVPSSEFVEAIAERIRARVAEPVPFEGVNLKVGASIGTCLVPGQASNLQEALKIADDMQREAKQQSKSRSARRQMAAAERVW
jgi:diguanylate cyclase (GGDEF)-like protein